MRIESLVCVKCGGPLGGVTAIPAVVECQFCGATISVGLQNATVTSLGAPDDRRLEQLDSSRKAFVAQLSAALQAGQEPYIALREASAAHLGAAGQGESLTRVTLALAADFESTNPNVLRDPIVLARIAEAYLRSIAELATATSYEINLPFITANERGPVHLQRTITAAELVELAHRDPPAPKVPEPVAAAPAAEPPKKKRWWQF